MAAVLLDTHTWAWSLTADPRLSVPATQAIEAAEAVHVSPISFFEIGRSVRIGKWPEMAAHAADLPALLNRQGGLAATLTPEIAMLAALMDWDHRDPFDRILAATATTTGWALISADPVFDGLAGSETPVRRLW